MNQLKTIEEMNEMPLNELENYTNELYMLWSQSTKIREYRKEMANDRVLLNSNVIDIPLLTNGEEE
tara:strand:+ start:33 stop:230 length:198 start_codon:yes stop_codon:yes gene_type:complete